MMQKKYEELTFSEVLALELGVMDASAASMCRENKIPILVFDLNRPDNIVDAIKGDSIGTVVKC